MNSTVSFTNGHFAGLMLLARNSRIGLLSSLDMMLFSAFGMMLFMRVGRLDTRYGGDDDGDQ